MLAQKGLRMAHNSGLWRWSSTHSSSRWSCSIRLNFGRAKRIQLFSTSLCKASIVSLNSVKLYNIISISVTEDTNIEKSDSVREEPDDMNNNSMPTLALRLCIMGIPASIYMWSRTSHPHDICWFGSPNFRIYGLGLPDLRIYVGQDVT